MGTVWLDFTAKKKKKGNRKNDLLTAQKIGFSQSVTGSLFSSATISVLVFFTPIQKFNLTISARTFIVEFLVARNCPKISSLTCWRHIATLLSGTNILFFVYFRESGQKMHLCNAYCYEGI